MDANQPEAVRSLHRWGFQTRSDVTLPPKDQHLREEVLSPVEFKERVVGRADLFVERGGRAAAIEVKNGDLSFDFARLEPEKRRWAETFCRPAPYSMEYWIWLRLGTDPPNRNRETADPQRTWLVPYLSWLWMESQVLPYQNSLPYRAGKHYGREVQSRQLDAIHLLSAFELRWLNSNDKWAIDPVHWFHMAYIAPPPLPLYTLPETQYVQLTEYRQHQQRVQRSPIAFNEI